MAISSKTVVYTDENGTNYLTRVSAAVFAQDDAGAPAVPLIGGRDAAGAADQSLPLLPRSLKPRSVTVYNAANGKRRKVPCLTADAPLYTGAILSINLLDGGGVSAAYSRVSPQGERRQGMSVLND